MLIKKIIMLAAVIGVVSAYSPVYGSDIKISDSGFITDGESYSFKNMPFEYNSRIYVCANDIFKAIGFDIEYDNNIKGEILRRNGKDSIIFDNDNSHIIGYKQYKYNNYTMIVNNALYIDTDLLEDVSGESVEIVGEISERVDFDKHRIAEKNIDTIDDMTVLNRKYIFERVSIQNGNAESYAQIVNMIAEKLPNVNVYNMLVPDFSEIYAPKNLSTNQSASFELIYNNLSDKVTPIRVINSLLEHGDEKLYFQTDHHWTQRGAYYAWAEFAKLKNFSIHSLEEFDTKNTDSFSGSFIQNLNTDSISEVLDNSGELLERFMPIYDVKATVYTDAQMKNKIGTVPLVNENNNTYSCFLSGDHPLTVLKSSIGNGKSIAIIKESFGNAFAAWAVNNYENVYVIDVRGFKDANPGISEFYNQMHFDDLIIESYPTSIESSDLRILLMGFAN